jgi:hypothetical protein
MRAAAWEAIHVMYAADTGSGGLAHASSPVITGMYNERAPTGQSKPYVVWNVQDDGEEAAKGADGALLRCSFNIYLAATVGMDGFEVIVRRLRTVFNRKLPTAISGYRFSYMSRVGGLFVPEDEDTLHHVEQYQLYVFAT